MMREEMGFVSRDIDWPEGAARPSVLVVGAGASGIIMGARLDRMGLDYDIVERGASVGGVWRDNRYPGAGVDTPNHAYSFSFARPHRWSRFFSPQADLETYLQQTADDCDVTRHVQFETGLTGAQWDDDAQEWRVELETLNGSESRSYQVLISAIGQLNVPKPPPVPGTDRFEGPCFHSSHWPDGLDLTGKRVAVIGTGASSMQIVPAIADQVAELTVYQRTAQWARPIPRYQRTNSRRLAVAVRALAVLCGVVPLRHAVAVRRRSPPAPAERPGLGARALHQSSQRTSPSADG